MRPTTSAFSNNNGNNYSNGRQRRGKFGVASTINSVTDFDSASILSYDNSAIVHKSGHNGNNNNNNNIKEEMWPALNGRQQVFDGDNSLSANFYNKLNKIDKIMVVEDILMMVIILKMILKVSLVHLLLD